MSAALKVVDAPTAEALALETVQNFMAPICAAGFVWTEQVGGWGGLHVGRSASDGRWWARWGNAEGNPEGAGETITAALVELLRELGTTLGEWAKDDDHLLEAALAASVALVKAGGAT